AALPRSASVRALASIYLTAWIPVTVALVSAEAAIASALVAVPPAYSPSRNVVIVATEPDLFVHAINNATGARQWRVRPVHSSRNFSDPTEF
ncbi:MAG: hypothetical protein RMJ55_13920, partial [Roseiflexaceae bacterium]|nr:hypothetical protein [Roseiflexaceae bacterium]